MAYGVLSKVQPYHDDSKCHNEIINRTPGGHTGKSPSERGQQDEVWQPQTEEAAFPAHAGATSLLCFS